MSCVTGPYFHDGSMDTLWDVTDHYNKGDEITDPWLDKDMQPLALTEPEIDDVVAFLASLTKPHSTRELGDRGVLHVTWVCPSGAAHSGTVPPAYGARPKQPPPPPL